MGEISASPSCRPMRSAASMRRLVTSSGRCTDPCVLQKCPPCASTTTRSPVVHMHYLEHLPNGHVQQLLGGGWCASEVS